ncbi:hypothetical protein [Paraburkholderia sp. CI3]|uniref:hypothetical protein n=1 Tax=Paraburkholderia sp. CI3 TaxID=2991060 RepID=UPI003D19CB41
MAGSDISNVAALVEHMRTSKFDLGSMLTAKARSAERTHTAGTLRDQLNHQAWNMAKLAAQTPKQFEAFALLIGMDRHSEQIETLRFALQAISHLERNELAFAPQSSGSQVRPDPASASLAARVLHATLAMLAPDRPAPAGDQVGDIYAWRQGYREDGPGSDLALTKERIYKFVSEYVRRAECPRSLGDAVKNQNRQPMNLRTLRSFGTHHRPVNAIYDGVNGHLDDILKKCIGPELDNHYRILDAGDPQVALMSYAILNFWRGIPKDRREKYKLLDADIRKICKHASGILDGARRDCSRSEAYKADPVDVEVTLHNLERFASSLPGTGNQSVKHPELDRLRNARLSIEMFDTVSHATICRTTARRNSTTSSMSSRCITSSTSCSTRQSRWPSDRRHSQAVKRWQTTCGTALPGHSAISAMSPSATRARRSPSMDRACMPVQR